MTSQNAKIFTFQEGAENNRIPHSKSHTVSDIQGLIKINANIIEKLVNCFKIVCGGFKNSNFLSL